LTKRVLLEQCRRSMAVTEDELYMFKKNNDIWWIHHDEGHIQVVKCIIQYLDNISGSINKKEFRKFLNKKIKKALKIRTDLDIKYNLFKNDEEISEEDQKVYAFNSGIDCEAKTFLRIINGKNYYDKKSYESTDWVSLGLIKK